MRYNIDTKHSTKAERIFYEILKKNKIPFRFREKVSGREVDFIIGKYAVELDGHPQSSSRNRWLFNLGYIPLHYSNDLLYKSRDKVEQMIINKLKYGLNG